MRRKIGVVTAVFLLVLIALVVGNEVLAVWSDYAGGRIVVTAHAGCDGTPDDSLESIEMGLASGADAVEVDVRFQDGILPVLAHDELESSTQYYLLEEALTLIAESDTLMVNLDLKEFNLDGLRAVQELVRNNGLLDRAFFTGVEMRNVPYIQEACPQMRYMLNLNPSLPQKNLKSYAQSVADTVRDSGAFALNCNYHFISATLVDTLHENGLLASVWTVNSASAAKRMQRINVDSITTRQAKMMIQTLKSNLLTSIGASVPTDISTPVPSAPAPSPVLAEASSPEEPVSAVENDLEYSDLAGIEFWFGSGAGAWCTIVEIYPDGTFSGYYHDWELGSHGAEYPNGTRYESYFSGKFSELQKTGDYEYSMRCETLNTEGTLGEEKIEDGVLLITSAPSGFDNADEFFLYLPGKKTENLSEEFLSWVRLIVSGDDFTDGVFTSYALHNVGGEQGFMG